MTRSASALTGSSSTSLVLDGIDEALGLRVERMLAPR